MIELLTSRCSRPVAHPDTYALRGENLPVGTSEIAATATDTPPMPAAELLARARAGRRHIVLPEDGDDRVSRAAEQTTCRGVALIFRVLNTGSTTNEAVRRAADAVAVGPMLHGLRRPVNDPSRGCTVIDDRDTVAIPAVQARERPVNG